MLLWVGLLAAWACWVQAQTGRSADGGIAGRGMSPRERLVFLLLLVPPVAVCLAAQLRTDLLAGQSLQHRPRLPVPVGERDGPVAGTDGCADRCCWV